jgi:replicative DNA helicase
LAALFFSSYKTNKEFYQGVFDTLEKYTPNEEAVKQLIVSIKRSKVLRELSISAYEVAEGKKPYDDIQKLVQTLSEEDGQSEDEEEDAFITDDLSYLLDSTYKTPGLRFRLKALCRALGSLRRGDFGFIFARPETGKTTFLASEVSFMAEQLQPGEIVLWINNEEQNNKVKSRVYQAELGVTLQELSANPAKWEAQYKASIGGCICIPNQTNYNYWDVDKLCKRYKPKLIVIDQLSKIQGFKGDREDLVLGAKFQWGRQLAHEYGPVIGVHQADGSGEGKKWLTMDNVANVKTAAQAEADWILGIGAIHDTGWEHMRFLNISKNKLAGDAESDEQMRHAKIEVIIEPHIARYRDL